MGLRMKNRKVKVFEVKLDSCYRHVLNKWDGAVRPNRPSVNLFEAFESPNKFGKYLGKGYSWELLPNMHKMVQYTHVKSYRQKTATKDVPCVLVVKNKQNVVWGVWNYANLDW